MLDDSLKLIKKITDAGFEAYIVGGFVRDYIMGIDSNDIDVTTNARPKDLREIFKDSIIPKEDYGSVTVIFNNIRFEITTYRKEISYVSNRKPDEIVYIDKADKQMKEMVYQTDWINKHKKHVDICFKAKCLQWCLKSELDEE